MRVPRYEYQMMQFIRWDTPVTTFAGIKANVRIDDDEAIRDTMRINDDGSLRIPNVNREKHQGIWRCHRSSRGRGQVKEVNAGSGGGGVDVRTNQVLVKLSVSSSKPRQQQQAKLNRKQKFYISLISFTWKH